MPLKFNLRKILVPTDFSDHSMGALRYAAAMAKHSDAEIILLHVIEGYGNNAELEHVININEALKKAVSDKLVELKNENIDLWGIKISVAIENGKIYQKINEVLKREKIDLVVMGTHGSSGKESFERFILGSNAYRVIRIADCPVITVREDPGEVFFKNIVLPLDTAKETKDKVKSAIKMARIFKSTIHLVSVSTRFDEIITGADKLKKQLDEVAQQVKDAGIPVITKVIRNEGVATSVLEYAESVYADLIMIMTAEENTLAEFALGSRAKKVVSESKIPVMSFRPGYQ